MVEKKSTLNFVQDTSGNIERGCKFVMKQHKDLEVLSCLRFLYTYKLGDPRWDADGMPVEAFTKKLSNRERDVYARDVEICVHADSWHEKTREQKARLLFRQLIGIRIEIESGESLDVAQDDAGRVKFRVDVPELTVRVFEREFEEYGLPAVYKQTVKTLAQSKEDDGEEEE